MRAVGKLSALAVQRQKKTGRYGDGGGLWLQVSASGGKSWIFRFMYDGRERHMGLGPVDVVSLAEARELARENRRVLFEGRDPLGARHAAREAAKAASARVWTFAQCAESYIAAHEASWRNAIHRNQWKTTLSSYAYPVFGDLPVAEIDTALVLKVLEPLWTVKAETASRTRGRIESVLDWARVRGYRSGENPARWRGHLDHLLPARSKVAKVKHHEALPFADVPEFMSRLRARDSLSARALELTILTGARTGEIVGAKWSEMDLAKRVWIVPPERMKAGREHRVPLAERAVGILTGLPRENGSEFVFIGARAARPLSNMAMLELLRGMTTHGLTVHGFRSSFRDWAAECTRHPSEVVEMALAHVVADKVEAAYRRGDLFEKRRELMTDWEKFCEGKN